MLVTAWKPTDLCKEEIKPHTVSVGPVLIHFCKEKQDIKYDSSVLLQEKDFNYL